MHSDRLWNGALLQLIRSLLNFQLLVRSKLWMPRQKCQFTTDFVLNALLWHTVRQRLVACICNFLVVFASANVAGVDRHNNLRLYCTAPDHNGLDHHQRTNVLCAQLADCSDIVLWSRTVYDRYIAEVRKKGTNFDGRPWVFFLVDPGFIMVGFEGCLCDVLQGFARTFTWFTELNEMYVIGVGFLASFRHQLWGNCGKHVGISLCIELESIDQVYFVLFSEKGFEVLHKDFEGRSLTVCDLLLIYKKNTNWIKYFLFSNIGSDFSIS